MLPPNVELCTTQGPPQGVHRVAAANGTPWVLRRQTVGCPYRGFAPNGSKTSSGFFSPWMPQKEQSLDIVRFYERLLEHAIERVRAKDHGRGWCNLSTPDRHLLRYRHKRGIRSCAPSGSRSRGRNRQESRRHRHGLELS